MNHGQVAFGFLKLNLMLNLPIFDSFLQLWIVSNKSRKKAGSEHTQNFVIVHFVHSFVGLANRQFVIEVTMRIDSCENLKPPSMVNFQM